MWDWFRNFRGRLAMLFGDEVVRYLKSIDGRLKAIQEALAVKGDAMTPQESEGFSEKMRDEADRIRGVAKPQ